MSLSIFPVDYYNIVDENPHALSYTFSDQVAEDDNLIIEGDNLQSLIALENSVFDVIYIDPPYNTGNNTFRYHDRKSEWPSFMYNRLQLARDLMKESASIFISIDDHEYHTLRIVTDAVFGSKNFVANFIWRKSHTVKNDKRGISTQHEYVLCYAKDISRVHFNREQTGVSYIDKAYRHTDAVGRYRTVPLHKEKNKKSFPVKAPNGTVWNKKWNYNEEGFATLIANDLVHWGKDGTACPTKKVYLKPPADMTKTYGTMFPPEKVGYTGAGGSALEALGFKKSDFIYAKPVELITHILEMATTPDSRVLDFFAGSGTTGEAVMTLNSRDAGKRTFVLCNSNESDICQKLTLPRVLKAKDVLAAQSAIKFVKTLEK